MEKRGINKDEEKNNQSKKNNNNNEKNSNKKNEDNEKDIIIFEENDKNDKLKSEEKAENKNKENSENEVISLINQIENNNISFNLSNFSISHNESKEILFTPPTSEIKEENKSIICNQSCDLFDNNNNVNLDLKEIEERK
jgi:hypothetical protein